MSQKVATPLGILEILGQFETFNSLIDAFIHRPAQQGVQPTSLRSGVSGREIRALQTVAVGHGKIAEILIYVSENKVEFTRK